MCTKRCSGLFLVLFICIELYYTQKLDLPEGYDCHLSNNEIGVCKPLNECTTAVRELKEEKIRPIICSFQGILPVVCCKNVFNVEEVRTEPSAAITENNQRLIISYVPYSENEGKDEGGACNLLNGNPGTCEYIKNCDFRTNTIRRSNWNWCSRQMICCHRKKSKHILACNVYKDQFNAEWIFDPDIEIINDDTSLNTIQNNTMKVDAADNAAARFGDFQHVALIGSGTEENKVWFCAGALISEKFVLTTAQCVNPRRDGGAKYVRMGEFVMNSFLRRDREDFPIRRTVTHPYYNRTELYNDIALIELERDVIFTAFIHPACLHDDLNIPMRMNATGWRINGQNMEDNLLTMEINVNSYEECQSRFNSRRNQLSLGIHNYTQICGTGVETLDCMYGSGAPLQTRIGTNLHSVVGVTSVEELCAKTSSPNIYTRVSAYIPWIASVVWN